MKVVNALLVIAVFSLIILSGITKINDTDTMMYLANGRYNLTNGLPKSCVFTHSIDTCSLSYPEWFLGVFLYSLYQLGQWNLLVIFQSIIITIMLALVFISCRSLRVSLTSTVIFLIFAVLIGMERFMLRADLVSLVVATLVFFLLKKIYYSWYHLSSLKYNRFLREINYKIGTIYEAKGAAYKARQYYEQELKLQPAYKPAIERIVRLRLQ